MWEKLAADALSMVSYGRCQNS